MTIKDINDRMYKLGTLEQEELSNMYISSLKFFEYSYRIENTYNASKQSFWRGVNYNCFNVLQMCDSRHNKFYVECQNEFTRYAKHRAKKEAKRLPKYWPLCDDF